MTTEDYAHRANEIVPPDHLIENAARERQSQLTKPHGSLGVLEAIGVQLSAIARACPPPLLDRVTIAVFAGDHGVVASGVTPWPQEVTAQMVANFCAGGAAINVLARHAGAEVLVVDVGVATPIPGDTSSLLSRNVERGTNDLFHGPAMSHDEAIAALNVGVDVAVQAVSDGAQMLVTGDMGIGNTTASAALIAAFTQASPSDVTGRGTGIDDATLELKTRVVETALARLNERSEPLDVLAEVGGLEIAAIAGFIIGGAAMGAPILIDGVIAVASALVATALAPVATSYLIAGHRSSEPGARIGLDHLGLIPLLDLELRLGEGSGAALAIPIVQAAAKIMNEMATFESANVTERDS